MKPGRRLFRRTRRQVRRDVEDELTWHLEVRMTDLEGEGMPPAAARAEAGRRFGDVSEVVDDCVASDLRRERRLERREVLGDAVQDARIGLRQLARRRALRSMTE